MPAETTRLKVFLCHASQDKPIARDLYRKLAAERWIDPWLDEKKLLPGQDWELEIEKALETVDVVIVLLSNISVTREGYIQKELRYALDIALEKPEGRIFIIPIRLDDCMVPRKIRQWQYVDYFPASNFGYAYERLIESLNLQAFEKGIATIPRVDVKSVKLEYKPIDFGPTDVRRMPVYLLLEADESMSGAPIMAVEQGVQLLHNELMCHPEALEMIYLSVIVYSTYAQQVVPLTPIAAFSSPTLGSAGNRNLGNALRVLADCIHKDIVRDTKSKKGDYKALVFWITGGEPADDWQEGLSYLKKRTNGLIQPPIAMGCGDSFNIHILREVTPNVLFMTDITPDKLRSYFRWESQPRIMSIVPFAPKPIKLKPASPAEWQVVEPPFELADRVPHSLINSLQAGEDWYILGASRRGKLHEHEGMFREDAFDIEYIAGWILVAVADGAGSHPLSRVGSNLVVKTAIAEMEKGVKKDPPSETVALVILQNAMRQAWIALSKEAQTRKIDVRDLSTTLLLLMYHPRSNLVGVAQVGDGLIAGQFEDGQIFPLGKPETGEHWGETSFLTNHKPEELPDRCEALQAPQPIRYFFVMTDGVADDLYPPKEKLPGLIKAMPSVMAAEFPDREILELINYNRPGSFDDRTLVVVCKRAEIAAQAHK